MSEQTTNTQPVQEAKPTEQPKPVETAKVEAPQEKVVDTNSQAIQQANAKSVEHNDPITAGVPEPMKIAGIAKEKENIVSQPTVPVQVQEKSADGTITPQNQVIPPKDAVSTIGVVPSASSQENKVEEEPVDPLIARHLPGGDPFTNLNMFKNEDGSDKSKEEVDGLMGSAPGRFRIY
jgi:hypothetical protein